ncbi:DUF1801 domain-containing protein [Microbacterium sp. X-17]|uniref:DUF1801 domain-containing protein n=1 Tax=Microbacterium sp. X-17 TaxID=3144404 RepID=UPI0031F48080
MTDTNEPGGLSVVERTAIKARAAELRAEAKRAKAADKAAADAADVLAKIAEMPDGDRELAQRLHAIVAEVAPGLSPKLYYGQPGYARGGKVVVFFRSGQVDRVRYSTLGVSSEAILDDASGMWATSYALSEPTEAAWERVVEVVRRVGGDH